MLRPDRKDLIFLAAIFSLSYLLGLQYYLSTKVTVDDFYLIDPILNFLRGEKLPPLKYPDFPYIFYGSIYYFLSFIFKEIQIQQLFHIVNLLLFSINGCLFYIITRPYLEKDWRFLASLLVVFSPAVFFSGIAVKTESLLLFLIFLIIYCVQRFLEKPPRWKWVILSGVFSGLCLTTKYMPGFLIFILALFWEEKLLFKRIFKNSKLWVFLGIFLVTVLITWPSIWKFQNPFLGNAHKADDYFTLFPSAGRAIDEWFAFPDGKYSSALVKALPLAAGIISYLAFIFAIFLNLIPKKIWIIWGALSIGYLILILNVTLMRYHYLFTPSIPFIVLGATLFFRKISEKLAENGWSYFSKIWATIPLMFCFLQYPMYSDMAYQYHENLEYLNEEILDEISPDKKDDLWALVLSSQEKNYSWENLDNEIKDKRPKYIFAYDSLFYNYCKYQNIDYQRQCKFFKSLLEGKENYEVIWENPIRFPFKSLFFDPELSMTFFLLQKNG